EVVFVTLSGFKEGRARVTQLREQAERHGRDPGRLRVLQGMCLIVAEDAAQARARAADYLRLSSRGGLLTKWCGWSGVDLASYPEDTPLSELRGQDMHSVT